MMIAFDADASSTSDSLMAPTPERMMRILTFSSDSLVSVSASTSAEPCTSALTMSGSSFMPPSAICSLSDSSVRRPPLAPSARSLACACRNVAICRAFAASATVWNGSPGCGRLVRPSTSTGVDGPADFVGRPRSSMSARTLPTTGPAMKLSPTLSVPSCTSTVATGPRPRSSLASSTVPDALRFGFALQLEDVGGQQNHLEQLIEVLPLLGRDRHHDRLAAPVFGHEVQLGQLALDVVGIGARLVDLVDRDDDRHVGRLGVVDRLARLRHDAVVGRDDEHDDVGDLGAAGAHQRERFVARRVEEDDAAAVADVDVIGADVLRDAAGFALGDLRFADGVEQRRLAVIDVAHDGDDRRARLHVLGTRLLAFGRDELLFEAPHLDLGAELAGDVLGRPRCRACC